MEIVEEYCPICEKTHEVELHTRIISIYGVRSMEEYFICPAADKTDNEFITKKQFRRNILRHKLARKAVGLSANF